MCVFTVCVHASLTVRVCSASASACTRVCFAHMLAALSPSLPRLETAAAIVALSASIRCCSRVTNRSAWTCTRQPCLSQSKAYQSAANRRPPPALVCADTARRGPVQSVAGRTLRAHAATSRSTPRPSRHRRGCRAMPPPACLRYSSNYLSSSGGGCEVRSACLMCEEADCRG
jgi:hypothetical protein